MPNKCKRTRRLLSSWLVTAATEQISQGFAAKGLCVLAVSLRILQASTNHWMTLSKLPKLPEPLLGNGIRLKFSRLRLPPIANRAFNWITMSYARFASTLIKQICAMLHCWVAKHAVISCAKSVLLIGCVRRLKTIATLFGARTINAAVSSLPNSAILSSERRARLAKSSGH